MLGEQLDECDATSEVILNRVTVNGGQCTVYSKSQHRIEHIAEESVL
jgi:hypothetical protein